MLISILFSTLLPLLALAQSATQAAPPKQTQDTRYNGGDDHPPDPDDAGSAGASKGAFALSKGGLIAIIVVAVVVAVLGAASAALFWMAKKRQWDVRQSLRRVSRRFTGRSEPTKRQNRRTGVRLDSPPPRRPKPQHQDKDIEKALPTSSQHPRTTTTITSTFDVDTPAQKGWKKTVLSGSK